jgi:hypothetical protein
MSEEGETTMGEAEADARSRTGTVDQAAARQGAGPTVVDD